MPRRPPSPFDQLIDIVSDAAERFVDNLTDSIERSALPPAPGTREAHDGERGSNRRRKANGAPRQQKTHYDTLGVSPQAEPEVIKAAYVALAKKYHPDHEHKGAEEKMRLINQAYEVLKDPQKRSEYDLATRS